MVFDDRKYMSPVYAYGAEVITQDISCGYAVIKMFSVWDGGDVTEETLYNQYGKVVTSNFPQEIYELALNKVPFRGIEYISSSFSKLYIKRLWPSVIQQWVESFLRFNTIK